MKKIHNFSIRILLLLIHFALPLHGMAKSPTRSANPTAQSDDAIEALVVQVHASNMTMTTSLFNLINQNQEKQDARHEETNNRLRELERILQNFMRSAGRKDLPQILDGPRNAPVVAAASNSTTAGKDLAVINNNSSSADSTPSIKKRDVEQELRGAIALREKQLIDLYKIEDEETTSKRDKEAYGKYKRLGILSENEIHKAIDYQFECLAKINVQKTFLLLDRMTLLEHMPEWRSSFDKLYITSLKEKVDFLNRELTKSLNTVNCVNNLIGEPTSFHWDMTLCSEKIESVMREADRGITLALKAIQDVRNVNAIMAN